METIKKLSEILDKVRWTDSPSSEGDLPAPRFRYQSVTKKVTNGLDIPQVMPHTGYINKTSGWLAT
jgi:hypothetical protein